MAIAKVLLFYQFTPLADPEAVKLWQRSVAERLKLRGRIIVSPHGINGTLGGELGACKAYVRELKSYPAFKAIDMKWSEGSGIDAAGYSQDFPRLSVKARREIVSFGVPDEVIVDEQGVVGGGTHLTPEEVNEMVANRDDVVFLDGRNRIEAEVGRFRDAVVPNVNNTWEFVQQIESGAFDHIKNRPIISYCTGGIRCEVLSALLRNRGFSEVYQIQGGIVRYLERYGTSSHYQGALTVFDGREVVGDGEPISQCHRCHQPVARLQNCSDLACRVRLVTCEQCGRDDVWCAAHHPSDVSGSK